MSYITYAYIIWSHLPKKPLMENVIFCAVRAVHNG